MSAWSRGSGGLMVETTAPTAPGELAVVQAFVNTSYGQGQQAHRALTTPLELRSWLHEHGLVAADAPVTEGDLRRAVALRESLRALLQAHTHGDAPAVSTLEHLNQL